MVTTERLLDLLHYGEHLMLECKKKHLMMLYPI
jgi:hypothetical protein